ncbi:hypothetical protein BTO06_01120 [Tenacibaculum sp. SZ-18]|uniref:hypothetical protein n=1 Tax=Tenacibaculum sp. SZ-18 TaxID=754423 RepID=UPI000C2D2564|nr:hypothetical protein [Tenacibaculum sp. SZ-18]AUC13835.1 hypothetical protein BTO06_01120 [Tenacibaculum sp. SZ-18]
MEVLGVSQAWYVEKTDAKGRAYFGMKGDEIVLSIHLSEKSNVIVKRVEDGCESVYVSAEEVTELSLGYVKSKCLFVETNPESEVRLLILK